MPTPTQHTKKGREMPKLVFVTGGVFSGLGKGIISSSIAKLLLLRGIDVCCVKIDPYLNVDAGTMRPTEHGEVFVTDDGYEADQDLGNYERFLNLDLSRENNITSGQIFSEVIARERRGDYLGKTVQLIPHVTDEIKRRIMLVAQKHEVTVVEIGGTAGDYEHDVYLEAARQLSLELGANNLCFVHVAYVPMIDAIGEQKTKPMQHSIRLLRETGIIPDFLVCRSHVGIDEQRREKIAVFATLPASAIFSAPDVKLIYEVPLLLEQEGLSRSIMEKLRLEPRFDRLDEWERLVWRFKNAAKMVRIGIVGKYVASGKFSLADSYVSVNEAVRHAAAWCGAKAEIEWVDSTELEKMPDEEVERQLSTLDAVIVPGGFGAAGVEGKLNAIKYCREHEKPFLGLCYGMQLAVVEYARNVLGLRGAHTAEIEPGAECGVVCLLDEQRKIATKGGTMRLGAMPAKLVEGSRVSSLYKKFGLENGGVVWERHRHRYEVNPNFAEKLEASGMVFSGKSPDGKLMEFLELPRHKFFAATQAHPEFKSRPERPAPLFFGLIEAALAK